MIFLNKLVGIYLKIRRYFRPNGERWGSMAGTLSGGSKTDVEVALEVEVAVADDVRTVSSFPDDGLEQRKKGRKED